MDKACFCNGQMIHVQDVECDLIIGLKTQTQLQQALMNIGFDITCGSCAAQFYTGISNYAHNLACKTKK